jgi:hypothetical protein
MNALISCKTCGLIQQLDHLPRGHQAECARCGEIILRYQPLSSALTAAFSLAALFLYVPANNYPVLSMHYLGRQTENTVWGGVRELWRDGMWGVARGQPVHQIPHRRLLIRREFQPHRTGREVNAIDPDQQIKRPAQRAEEMIFQFLCLSPGLPGFMAYQGGGRPVQQQHE